jgi:hypothetical protein
METRLPPLLRALAVFALASLGPTAEARAELAYPWLQGRAPIRNLEKSIQPPEGFARVKVAPGSFAAWLRRLPLKAAGAKVKLYDGREKCFGTARPGLFACADYHAAIIDIDTGHRDLQQCADAVMRLRGEYLLAAGRAGSIAFNATGGKAMRFGGGSYSTFRRYLDRVFAFAGSYSLERELRPVKLTDIQPGDVFIEGGFPGHAVLAADVAENTATGEKAFLLLQSFMPAQDIHILNNPKAHASPWFRAEEGRKLVTPEWIFPPGHLRRFRD